MIKRDTKTANYTVMSNEHLRNRQMSLKAKGMLSMMLSLPDDWHFSIEGITSMCKESKSAVSTAINELKKLGYLETVRRFPNQTESGRFEYEYIVREHSIKGDDR